MITVYGADWCEDTQRSLRHLRRLGVPYSYLDVDEDLAALGRAKALNAGERLTPTIDVDGSALVEPTNERLTAVLQQRGMVSGEQVERRMRTYNVGDAERGLRIGGGLLTMALAIRMKGGWKWPLAAWGAFQAVSGAVGSCPLYSAMGVTSHGGPGDRPREAERSSWFAPVVTPSAGRELQAEE